jgi:galactose mutarotase-like enzyme
MTAPSGEQIEIEAHGQRAVVVEIGGGLRSYAAQGRELLDGYPDVNRRSLAVEPMTCPPNAFSTGDALVRLQPGEPFTAAWGISPC